MWCTHAQSPVLYFFFFHLFIRVKEEKLKVLLMVQLKIQNDFPILLARSATIIDFRTKMVRPYLYQRVTQNMLSTYKGKRCSLKKKKEDMYNCSQSKQMPLTDQLTEIPPGLF